MKNIHKGKVIPDFIVRRESVVTDAGETREDMTLISKFDYTSRAFLRKCMSERDIKGSAALEEFFARTVMAMNIWWDGKRWESGRFTPEEYMDLVARADAKGKVAQYGKAKWPTGGGRSARAAGKFFWADTNVTDELYKKYLLVNPNSMDARQKVARTSILFAPGVKFTRPPVVKVLSTSMNGIAWLSPDYALEQGIQRGDKLWPIKASAEIAPFNMQGMDMMLPKDSVKFDDHTNDPSKMSRLMGWIPGLTAKDRSSQEKGRVPRLAMDTLQWFHPEIKSHLLADPHIVKTLEKVRRIVEGKATTEEILDIGKYEDKVTGEARWPMEFEFLRKGQPLESPMIRAAVFRAAGTAITKALCFTVGGKYGVGMPTITHNTRRRLAVVPPWMLPFWTDTDVEGTDVCGVNSDWMVGCLGKDYDGDLVIIMKLAWLQAKLGIKGDFFPDWTKRVVCSKTVATPPGSDVPETTCPKCEGRGYAFPDRAWAARYLALPEKGTAVDKRSVHDVMVDGLKSYNLIGIATNMSMVVIDAMRVEGKHTRRDLMGMYLKLMSTEVQQFVDALKYNPGGMMRPHLETKETRKGRKLLGMAAKYGVEDATALKVQTYFRAVRGMDFDALAGLDKDETLNGSFYYTLASLFRGWKPVEPLDMQKLGKLVSEKHPLPDSIERRRSMSFVKFNNDTEKRFHGLNGKDGMEHMLTNEEQKLALVARCWTRKDTSLALFIEAWWGKRLIDVADHASLEGAWVRLEAEAPVKHAVAK